VSTALGLAFINFHFQLPFFSLFSYYFSKIHISFPNSSVALKFCPKIGLTPFDFWAKFKKNRTLHPKLNIAVELE